ncbi:MAG: adenylyl-sulfate kinase [Planctomycetota bacterium]
MNQPKSKNISNLDLKVSRVEREALTGHRGVTVWFTGLSASGKSTVAVLVDQMLTARGAHCFVLDGDNIRQGLNRDLGFSPEDRNENIRRIGEVARLFSQAGIINLTAFISPYRGDRNQSRALQDPGDFIEVYVDSPLDVCERRDPRGLYRLAREGKIPEFTGISAPYEEPLQPELVLHTDRESEQESAAAVVAYLEKRGYLPGLQASQPEKRRVGSRARTTDPS